MSRRGPFHLFLFLVSPARLALLGSCVLAGACSTTPVATGSRLVVTSPSAQFYRNGPAQEMAFRNDPQTASLRTLTRDDYGADGILAKGTHVTMVKRELGYSRVMTENGTVGYVANDQITPAPAPMIARNFSAPTPATSRSAPAPRRAKPQRMEPPEEKLDLLDLPLPLPG